MTVPDMVSSALILIPSIHFLLSGTRTAGLQSLLKSSHGLYLSFVLNPFLVLQLQNSKPAQPTSFTWKQKNFVIVLSMKNCEDLGSVMRNAMNI